MAFDENWNQSESVFKKKFGLKINSEKIRSNPFYWKQENLKSHFHKAIKY
jgi:hypothetical protein